MGVRVGRVVVSRIWGLVIYLECGGSYRAAFIERNLWFCGIVFYRVFVGSIVQCWGWALAGFAHGPSVMR